MINLTTLKFLLRFVPTVLTIIASAFGIAFSQSDLGKNENITDKKSDASPWHREINVVKIENPPKIDGKLNDEIWKQVEFFGNFLQRNPVEGAQPSEKTEIAVTYDDNNLYIAAMCYDSEPDKILATEMRRDAYLFDDDYIEIIIDTFDDKRSAFYFKTNALGSRIDGMISDEGRNNNRDWDGVWDCKASINDEGWSVEIAIPFQTLRFKEGNNLVWNANFIRMIKRKNESVYWRLVSQSLGRNAKYRMSEAGRLQGFNNLKMGGNLEFKPYFSGGLDHIGMKTYKTDAVSDMGLDVKWNMTTTLTADFTYNTDFAQVEADQERVNLTRFSLFFPEKRDFYLEGAENFNFGRSSGGRMGRARASDIQLFHSRRIGITDGYQVPTVGGLRAGGKAGKYTLGLMSIQTERTLLPDDESTTSPETNFSILRLKRDIFSRSSVGIMVLNKQQSGDDYNRSFGFDSFFPVTDHFSVYGTAAGTYSANVSNSNNFAGNAGLTYDSDLWAYGISFLDIEDNFNPEMGYIRRTDIKRTNANIRFAPRPRRWDSIRQVTFSSKGYYQSDHNDVMLNRQINGGFSINFENSSRFNISFENEYEYLSDDWEVREGNIIPEGGYYTTTFRTSYNTDRSKSINANINFDGGDYFNGSKYGSRLSFDVKAWNKFRMNLNYSYNWVKLPNGQFHTNSISTRLSWSFNPDFFIKAYIQLLDDKLRNDGQTVVSSNILLRYIYKPGSDFYLVFNEGRMVGGGNEIIENRTILTKFTYFFRK